MNVTCRTKNQQFLLNVEPSCLHLFICIIRFAFMIFRSRLIYELVWHIMIFSFSDLLVLIS